MIAGKAAADARRGEELVAHRLRGLELRRDHPVDPRASGPSTKACGSTPACRRIGTGSEAVRRFRGATYRIAIGKPVGITGRITSLLVDGRQIDGNVVAPAPEGSDVTIEGTVA